MLRVLLFCAVFSPIEVLDLRVVLGLLLAIATVR
jgi:hypothetical protein